MYIKTYLLLFFIRCGTLSSHMLQHIYGPFSVKTTDSRPLMLFPCVTDSFDILSLLHCKSEVKTNFRMSVMKQRRKLMQKIKECKKLSLQILANLLS